MTPPTPATRRAARRSLRALSGKLLPSAPAKVHFPRNRRLASALTAAAVALVAAGCGGSGGPGLDETVPQPFAACAALLGAAAPSPGPASAHTSSPADAAATAPSRAGGIAASQAAGVRPAAKLRVVDLPELSLPCLAGGDDVRLSELRGPLVINLWGSWCEPCRAELPALQRLADSGRVPVLGVVTRDDRAKAAWLADELKIGMPAVYDRGGVLQAALGEKVLPMTLLVGPDGRAAVYRDVALTDEALSRLVDQHLGRV